MISIDLGTMIQAGVMAGITLYLRRAIHRWDCLHKRVRALEDGAVKHWKGYSPPDC